MRNFSKTAHLTQPDHDPPEMQNKNNIFDRIKLFLILFFTEI